MTLEQISSLVNKAMRFKIHPDEVVLALDAVNKLACTENLKAFKEYLQEVTIYQEIEFLAAGYTSAVVGDIGKAVVGGTSAVSGTLISYNNTTRKWVVNLAAADDYLVSEAITITTGTGAGTLIASDHQVGYMGPYAFPTSPPVRKMHGITTWTEAQIYGTDTAYVEANDDYGLDLTKQHRRYKYKPGRLDALDETFTFSSPPNRTDTYRFFYWFKPATISDVSTGATGDGAVIIPDTYHGQYQQATVGWLRAYVKSEPFTKQHVKAYLKDWWDELLEVYTPMGEKSNGTSIGSYLGDWF